MTQANTTTGPSDKTTDGPWSNMAGLYRISGQNPRSIPVHNVVPGTAEKIARYQALQGANERIEKVLIKKADEQHRIELCLSKTADRDKQE